MREAAPGFASAGRIASHVTSGVTSGVISGVISGAAIMAASAAQASRYRVFGLTLPAINLRAAA